MVLEIRTADGRLVWQARQARGQASDLDRQAAYLVTDILAGNTDPKQNDIWARQAGAANGPGGTRRRPAAVKTGTTNDARDLGTYGFLPADQERTGPGRRRLDGQQRPFLPARGEAGHLADRGRAAVAGVHARLHGLVAGRARSSPPKDVVRAQIDAWSGGRPGPWTRDTVSEWFIRGTQPGARQAIDPNGLLYRIGCGGWSVDPLQAELGPVSWEADVLNWMARARRGVGVVGRYGSATAYFWGQRSWGGPILGSCVSRPRGQGGGNHGNGKDKGNKEKPPKPDGTPPPPTPPPPAPGAPL